MLERVLHARMLTRLGNEPLAEVRARILQFPLEFAGLRRPLTTFIGAALPLQSVSRDAAVARLLLLERHPDGPAARSRAGEHVAWLQPAAGGWRGRTDEAADAAELLRHRAVPEGHLSRPRLGASAPPVGKSAARSGKPYRRRWSRSRCSLIVIPAALSYVENSDLAQATARDAAQSLALERAPGAGAAATAGALDLLVGRVQVLERAADAFHVRGLHRTVRGARALAGYQGRVPRAAALARQRPGADPARRRRARDRRPRADGLSELSDRLRRPEAVPDAVQDRALGRRLGPRRAWRRPGRRRSAPRRSTDEDKLATHAKYYVDALGHRQELCLAVRRRRRSRALKAG